MAAETRMSEAVIQEGPLGIPEKGYRKQRRSNI